MPCSRLNIRPGFLLLCVAVSGFFTDVFPSDTQLGIGSARQPSGIPIHFTLPSAGEVTLVVEDSSGRRIRNLISQSPYPKGTNAVYWDGSDDLGRDQDAADHGVYAIPKRIVKPGTYTVRGLWHDPLQLRYLMTVYSPGKPPWPTSDKSSGWMTNHTPASSAVFVPAGKGPESQPLIYLGAYVSEGGSALSWVDLDGRKVGGREWIGGNWTGAQYLALDNGLSADPKAGVYVAAVFGDKSHGYNPGEVRLTRLTTAGDRPVLQRPYSFSYSGEPARIAEALGGLTVHDGLLVFTQTSLNTVVLVDARLGTVLSRIALVSPRGVAFDSAGRLLLLSANSLLRFTITSNRMGLSQPEALIAGLNDPHGITVGPGGQIIISDQGSSNQVKVYSKEGRLVKVFGKPGLVAAGSYDPLHMNHPQGTAVDSNDRLWVAENDFQPKRVSVWNCDGTLWRAYYGPPQYGGGGVLDPEDSSRWFYHGMEFHLDWEKRKYELKRVFYRTADDLVPFRNSTLDERSGAPEAPVVISGRHYFSNAFNSHPTNGSPTAFLFLDAGNAALPVAGMGRAQDWALLGKEPFLKLWPKGVLPTSRNGRSPAFFIWSDLNGDHMPEPDEVTIRAAFSGGVTVERDGSFNVANMARGGEDMAGQAFHFRPVRVTDQGVPVFDLAHSEAVGPSQKPVSSGGDQLLIGKDGWVVQTTAPPPFPPTAIGGSRNGMPVWSYPSLWPGLHASHSSPAPDRPGILIGTTRVLGNIIDHPQAGPLFFLNGNQGDIYVFTQDGLFVSQLFQDVRQGKPWQMPTEQPGALLNDLTLHDENFFPSATLTGGKVYLTAGTIPALVRVDGLDTVHHIPPFQIQVTSDDLRRCEDAALETEKQRQSSAAPKVLNVRMLSHQPPLDGNPDNLKEIDWVSIDSRGVKAYFNANTKPYDTKGSLAIAGDKLLAVWKTGDPKLPDNAAPESTSLFHTGGGLDLMLQTDPNANPARTSAAKGDIRLLVSQLAGRTRAELYAPVAAGADPAAKAVFQSPSRSITFDRAEDVSERVQLAVDGRGGFEVAVPLALLGLKPVAGAKLKGDIGVLRGSGGQTIQRVYWSNKGTAIVADVPSEATLTPNLWGTLVMISGLPATAQRP
jgi:hypothetical protein